MRIDGNMADNTSLENITIKIDKITLGRWLTYYLPYLQRQIDTYVAELSDIKKERDVKGEELVEVRPRRGMSMWSQDTPRESQPIYKKRREVESGFSQYYYDKIKAIKDKLEVLEDIKMTVSLLWYLKDSKSDFIMNMREIAGMARIYELTNLVSVLKGITKIKDINKILEDRHSSTIIAKAILDDD